MYTLTKHEVYHIMHVLNSILSVIREDIDNVDETIGREEIEQSVEILEALVERSEG